MISYNELFSAIVDLQVALTEVANLPPSRDKLAAMAMQGMCASPRFDGSPLAQSMLTAAAYELADAMIAAREPKPGVK